MAEGDAEAPSAVIIGDGKELIQVLGADIRHIKAVPPVLHDSTKILTGPAYLLGWMDIAFCVVIGVYFWDKHQQMLARDSDFARQQRAYRSAS